MYFNKQWFSYMLQLRFQIPPPAAKFTKAQKLRIKMRYNSYTTKNTAG